MVWYGHIPVSKGPMPLVCVGIHVHAELNNLQATLTGLSSADHCGERSAYL